MRRYSPKSGSFTMGKVLVFFGAWNLIGFTIYNYVVRKEEEKEPGQWLSSTGAQKYLRFMNFGSENVQKITVKGFSSITTENLTPEEVQKFKGYNKSEEKKEQEEKTEKTEQTE